MIKELNTKFSRVLTLVVCLLFLAVSACAQINKAKTKGFIHYRSTVNASKSSGNNSRKNTRNNFDGRKKKRTTTSKYSTATGYSNGHGYVDLGLSVKWATCNVGASSPTEYGGYYAWGETITKPDYMYTEEDNVTYGKNFGDIAGTPYDVARTNWGGSWRLPTKSEIDELVAKCTTKWFTINGVTGCLVTSKRNGKSIFLPAACARSAGPLLGDGRPYGNYWSSTPSNGPYYSNWSYILNFGRDHFGTFLYPRGCGRTVRPVMK